MGVSIEDIKKLKELSGIGLTDAKKALVEAEGDFDKALEALRKKGLTKAEKKGDRETREGLIESYVHSGRIGVVVEKLISWRACQNLRSLRTKLLCRSQRWHQNMQQLRIFRATFTKRKSRSFWQATVCEISQRICASKLSKGNSTSILPNKSCLNKLSYLTTTKPSAS